MLHPAPGTNPTGPRLVPEKVTGAAPPGVPEQPPRSTAGALGDGHPASYLASPGELDFDR